MKIKLYILIVFLLLITGCGLTTMPKSQSIPKAKAPIEADLKLAEKIQAALQSNQAVDQSTAVVLNKDISVAIKVSGFNRLRLKQIRKEVHNKINQLTSKDYFIHITTDKRLFRDLQKIANQLQKANGTASCDIQDQVEVLNKDMTG